MSNKTNFKRVALAVVAALGFGVFSSGPSSAVIQVGSTMTATAVNTSVKTTETASVTIDFSFTSVGGADTVLVTAIRTSTTAPGGTIGFRKPVAADSSNVTSFDTASATNVAIRAVGGNDNVVTFKGRFDVAQPTTPGTYTYTFYASFPGGNAATPPAPVTYTFTVVGPDRVMASATSLIGSGMVAASGSDSLVVASGLGAASQVANIFATVSNAAGETTTQVGTFTESVTAVITGPGLLSVGANAADSSTTRARSVAFNAGSFVIVYNDGTPGVATVTLYKGLTSTVLATETLSFSGTAASATLSLGHTITSKQATDSQTVVRFVVKDAAGNALPTPGSWFIHSSDTKVVSNGTAACAGAYSPSLGYGTCGITIGDTGTTKIKIANYAASATTLPTPAIVSNELDLRVAGSAATVKLSFDKTTYSKQEEATLTLTVTDANGFVVPSQTIASLLSAGIALTPGDDVVDTSITLTKGVKTFTVDAPNLSGTWQAVYKGGAGLPTAGQVTDTVTVNAFDPTEEAANSALDAAQEATDAAIAATDAAILAQEAADEAASAAVAAQETAQAAVDAVTALSAEVTKLVAQLATLQKLLNRVAKRVGVKL